MKYINYIVYFLLLFFTSLWAYLYLTSSVEQPANYIFGATYGLIAVIGGVSGLFIAKKWGFLKSALGKSLVFFASGLLMQELGQIIFSYYNIFAHTEIPYPSLADIGFFGSIPLYIIGALYLAKSAGVEFSLKQAHSKILVVIIPLIMLVSAYILFLTNYDFMDVSPLQLILDFGYPLGEAVYISIALLTYVLSKKLLGGVLKKYILLLIFALSMQYVAEVNFLHQNLEGTWVNGRYGDYLYFLAYFTMTYALLGFANIYKKIKSS